MIFTRIQKRLKASKRMLKTAGVEIIEYKPTGTDFTYYRMIKYKTILLQEKLLSIN